MGKSSQIFLACFLGLALVASGRAQTVQLATPEATEGRVRTDRVAQNPDLGEAIGMEEYDGGTVFADSGWGSDCAACGGMSMTGECSACGGCLRGNCHYFDRFWFGAEYLFWWTQGMNTPPLVTTSPANTPQADAGVLPDAEILFGDESLFTNIRNGARFRGGAWLDYSHSLGIEGEFFFLEEDTERFRDASDGTRIIARPFFNVLTNEEDSELVSFPRVVRGEVIVEASSTIQSAGLRAVINLCCQQWCADQCLNGCPTTTPASSRWDMLLGYRYMHLDESLMIREGLVSLLGPPDNGTFDIRDQFATRNEFSGVDVGLRNSWTNARWGVDLLAKCAFGNNRQYVVIDGRTVTSINGVPATQVGGLLAQTTNIGEYSRNQFAAIPEFGATAYYQWTNRLRLSLGYTLVYWFDVVRPGDQIDRRVNTNLLPPPVLPLQGEAAPAFTFHETSLWLQGLSLGAEIRW